MGVILLYVLVRVGEEREAWKWRWRLFVWEEELVGNLG